MIVSPSGGKCETNVFTKDGRNIINSMNFVSPIEEIFKEMMVHIASRVDNKAGDGTTSSMYLAARFFELMTICQKNTTINSRQFARCYKKFHTLLMSKLCEQTITLDELCSMIGAKNIRQKQQVI